MISPSGLGTRLRPTDSTIDLNFDLYAQSCPTDREAECVVVALAPSRDVELTLTASTRPSSTTPALL